MHTPDTAPQLMAELARILAEPKRVHMLLALMDGRAYTATELALMAEIAPSTASSHLQKMLGVIFLKIGISLKLLHI